MRNDHWPLALTTGTDHHLIVTSGHTAFGTAVDPATDDQRTELRAHQTVVGLQFPIEANP